MRIPTIQILDFGLELKLSDIKMIRILITYLNLIYLQVIVN